MQIVSSLPVTRLISQTYVLETFQYLGLAPDDFHLTEGDFDTRGFEGHESDHIYRVMILSAVIARKTGLARSGQLAVIAAYVHDLARKYGDPNHLHGLLAWKKKQHLLEPLFSRYQVGPMEKLWVKGALVGHSGHLPFLPSFVFLILFEADSFDRLRSNGNFKTAFILPFLWSLRRGAEDMIVRTRRFPGGSLRDFIGQLAQEKVQPGCLN